MQRQVTVFDVEHVLAEIAPLRLAESWDNVGLLLGDANAPVDRVVLTIDLSEAVVEEAIADAADMIVAYHPPIFAPLKHLTAGEWRERLVLRCAENGIAIYSPHTALDSTPGGVNDWLAEGVAGDDVPSRISPLELHMERPDSQACKLVTFLPVEDVEPVREALSAHGAGIIGAYEQCSFELPGQGTFFAGAATRPVRGKQNRLERVDEVRLEMVCPGSPAALAQLIDALRQVHPYEEPAFDIYPLAPEPLTATGAGRLVELSPRRTLRQIVESIKSHCRVPEVRIAGAVGRQRTIDRVGVCAGAGGSLLHAAIRNGCTAFFTGEMRYHDVLDAQHRGCSVILAGHSNTERGYLRVLRRRLKKALRSIEITIAKRDRYPIRAM